MTDSNSLPNNTLQDGRVGILGAISGLLAVALGAFAAHGLKGRLSPGDLQIFETGVRYQMYHALALLLLAALQPRLSPASSRVAAWGFGLGTLVFSGSLYILVLGQLRWMGAVTPLGGVAFMVGWFALAWAFAGRDG